MFGLRALGKKLRALFGQPLHQDLVEALEEVFFEADLGSEVCTLLTEHIKLLLKNDPSMSSSSLLSAIKNHLLAECTIYPPRKEKPSMQIYLVVGANGNGKTTSAAKLAAQLTKEHSVLLVAADTFRAAAIDQLALWASRLTLECMKGQPMGDPAAICFDAVKRAQARHNTAIVIDTAGRLHTKHNLMEELKKIHRSILKALPTAHIETLLCIDATHGQNALTQAVSFHQAVPVSGIILTKMDGTAKGGIAIAIQKKMGVPIRYLGTGEGISDFIPFNPMSFVDSLFES